MFQVIWVCVETSQAKSYSSEPKVSFHSTLSCHIFIIHGLFKFNDRSFIQKPSLLSGNDPTTKVKKYRCVDERKPILQIALSRFISKATPVCSSSPALSKRWLARWATITHFFVTFCLCLLTETAGITQQRRKTDRCGDARVCESWEYFSAMCNGHS